MFDFALHYAWLIAAVPLLASALIAIFMKQLPEPKAGWVGTMAMGISLLLSLLVLGAAVTHGHAEGPGAFGAGGEALAQWNLIGMGGPFGGYTVELGLMIDNLTAMTLAMVTLVSFCVQLYSIGYMHGDKRFVKYYAAVNLFTFGMLLAVMGDNLLFLLIGWEIMGLCSYMLIGHWYEQPWPQLGSMKAFMTVRIGDAMMVIGVIALFALTGSLNFNDIAAALPEVVKSPIGLSATITAALLTFAGPVGKSAQFPLHTWLPDAMAGPTPGSALIHAATMVAVGVYLVARGFTVFALAGVSGEVLGIIALVGGFTSVFAASIATLRSDIKQVLAYSTISQLGYMMLALGAGSFSAGTFHLMTHAFFKGLLFLVAGSVIHAVHTQEMHQMGGLRKKMPITFWTWMIGTAALAGIPPFSGFWSKDELLLAAYNFPHTVAPHGWPEWVKWLPFVFGMMTAFLTAYYMTRATRLAFFDQPRDAEKYHHAHESPRLMTTPLIILAVPAALGGFMWAAKLGITWWEEFTHHAFQAVAHDGAGLVMAMATTLAFLGVVIGWFAYAPQRAPGRYRLLQSVRPLYTLVKNLYYVDELYEIVFIKGFRALATLVARVDELVVDGIVNAVGLAGAAWAEVAGWFDRVFVDGMVNGAGAVAMSSGRELRRMATGYAQSYMMTLAVVAVFGAVVVYWTLR